VTGRGLLNWFYFGSATFHVALAVGAYLLPTEQRTESVAIELADIKKKNEKPKPPPAPPPPPPKEKPKPPPPPPPPQAQAKTSQESVKPEAPAAEPLGADGFADLGSVALGNGTAGSGAGDGVGMAAPSKGNAPAAAKAAKAMVRKVEQLAPAASQACTEPDVSPKHVSQVLPKMTLAAQQAEIEGVVLIEVTIDPTGSVVEARVIHGLGYGLDEAALRAAKAWTFQPAMRCGRPIVGHKKIPFRFTLT
jgi:protein TonB